MDPQLSFTITFVSLLVSALLNMVESLRTTLPHVRHIMSLEATICLIASYFYSLFKTKGNWQQITQLRYLDWAFTTPMMLLAFCLVLTHNSKTKITAFAYISIVLLDFFMLYMGYLGETKKLDRTTADIGGYVGYIAMFGINLIM